MTTVDTSTVAGKRDYAILRLLWDLGLRRAEVASLNIGNYDPNTGSMSVLGKGRLSKEAISIAPSTCTALNNWLAVRGSQDKDQPLFIALDNRNSGTRISTKHIYRLVKAAGEAISSKPLSPHKIRHSAITAVLDASNGNVRLAQRFSRHKSLEVLIKYDDNRQQLQKEAISLIAGLV